MHVYKSNIISKNPITLDKYSVRLCSYVLNIPAQELNELLQYVEEVSDKKADSFKNSKQIILLEKYYQIFEDNTFLINTPRRDWILLGYIYVLNSKIPIDAIQQQLLSFVTFAHKRSKITSSYKELEGKVKDIYKEMRDLYAPNDVFVFFNHQEFLKIAKSMGVDSASTESNIILQWKDVEITNNMNQVLYYARIEIVIRIPDFYVTKFFLSTHGFRYDSDWEIDLPLHPNLNKMIILSWGRNNFLEFLPTNNYRAVIETFDDLVHGVNGFFNIQEVASNLKKLSLIWQNLDKGLEYNTRNKQLFESIKNLGEVKS